MSGQLTPGACTSSIPHEPCSLIKTGKLFLNISPSWLGSFLFHVLVLEDWACIRNLLQYKLLTNCGTEKTNTLVSLKNTPHLICFLMKLWKSRALSTSFPGPWERGWGVGQRHDVMSRIFWIWLVEMRVTVHASSLSLRIFSNYKKIIKSQQTHPRYLAH